MKFSRCYGSIIGAFVGDAAGAPLEFAGKVDVDAVKSAMNMSGGGSLQIGKGQITDDSELAMCQIQALKTHNSGFDLPVVSLINWYKKWYHSPPFDIGNTTGIAFGSVESETVDEHIQRVAQLNSESKSNGALMRQTPLVIWCRNLDIEKIIKNITLDTKLTHPNQTCIDSSIAYALTIISIIKHSGNVSQTLKITEKWVEENAVQEVQSWILDESNVNDLSDLKPITAIGFVKWAVIQTFYHLRQRSSYKKGIMETLLKGGDTDTNGAIVGGMLGALYGVEKIPNQMREAVLN